MISYHLKISCKVRPKWRGDSSKGLPVKCLIVRLSVRCARRLVFRSN